MVLKVGIILIYIVSRTKNINQCKFLEKCLLYVQFFYQLQYPPLKGIENQFLCRHWRIINLLLLDIKLILSKIWYYRCGLRVCHWTKAWENCKRILVCKWFILHFFHCNFSTSFYLLNNYLWLFSRDTRFIIDYF